VQCLVIAHVSEPRQRIAVVHDEADEAARALRFAFCERLQQQVVREAEPVLDRRQHLQVPMQRAGERGQQRRAVARERNERARIGCAELRPSTAAERELLRADRLAPLPKQAKRFRRQLPEADEPRRAGKVARSDELELRRRAVLGKPGKTT
jgi:hypothetical protein